MKPYIAVIDDDPLLREFVAQHLTAAGCQVATFGDGRSALISLVASRPDLIVLDVEMSPPNGMEVLRRLRGADWSWAIPVVMLTGRRQPGQIMEALQLGASDYLAKPLDPAALIARINRRLGCPEPDALPPAADLALVLD